MFLLFGGNCAGKSTLALVLAERLPRCAHIEVDALRYFVRGGLVAASRGMPPHRAPEEYRRQCLLGDENAALLARNFAAHGFSSVVEGLEDDHGPGSGWAQAALAGARVAHVLLTCSDEVLARRWRERCGSGLPVAAHEQAARFRSAAASFEIVLDSSDHTPIELADAVILRVGA